jgi:DNA-binding transcriptional regulator of glucitol operon
LFLLSFPTHNICIIKSTLDHFFNTELAQLCAVLIFNSNIFVILTAMTEKHGSEYVKSTLVTYGNNTAKPILGIALVRIMVIAALLLSGLALISIYQQRVIAQEQNMTGAGDGVNEGGLTTGVTGTAAQDGNATAEGAAGGNQSEVRLHLEEARTALENNNTQSALMHLDLALSALAVTGGTQGDTPTGTTLTGTDATDRNGEEEEEEEEDSECGAVTVGGTSAADDYGCPPDPDA